MALTDRQQAYIEAVADGWSVTRISAELHIDKHTGPKWARASPEFRAAVLAAREQYAHTLATEIARIGRIALEEPEKANGARVAIDAYKWLASKMAPRDYGERIEHSVVDERSRTPEQIQARIVELQAELGRQLVETRPVLESQAVPEGGVALLFHVKPHADAA